MSTNSLNIAIVGASGALGSAVVDLLTLNEQVDKIFALSRSDTYFPSSKVHSYFIDIEQEESIDSAAKLIQQQCPKLDRVLVLSGFLHDAYIMPEKSLRDLSAEKFQKLFAINAIGPALVAKYFLPMLCRDRKSVFAALSARVGSISDNRLGGWYAYRASKAALNMLLKNLSIEIARKNKQAIVLGLHPGTVDSALSQPFQQNVPEGKLFTPEYAAQQLITVIEQRTVKDTGLCFAWDGQEIHY